MPLLRPMRNAYVIEYAQEDVVTAMCVTVAHLAEMALQHRLCCAAHLSHDLALHLKPAAI